MSEQVTERKLTIKDLNTSYFMFEVFAQACCSYERLQAPGFFSGMKNVIAKLYTDPEERAEACQRHMEFYNSEFALVGPVILGLTIAMEEEKACGAEIDGLAISAVKTSLMGPLAGIGDTLRQGTLIPIIGSIAISIGQEGNLLGPIFYFFVTLALNFGISYTLYRKAYDKGRDFVGELFSGGKMEKIMTMVTAMGSITIGALAATTVKLTSTAEIALGDNKLAVQADILDKVVNNLLPFGMVMLTFYLMNKKVSVNKVLLILFAIGIIGGLLGIV